MWHLYTQSQRLDLLNRRWRRPFAALLHATASINAKEKREEDDGHAEAAHYSDSVTVEKARQEDCESLSQSHDDGEDGGAELRNGVENKELSTR